MFYSNLFLTVSNFIFKSSAQTSTELLSVSFLLQLSSLFYQPLLLKALCLDPSSEDALSVLLYLNRVGCDAAALYNKTLKLVCVSDSNKKKFLL